MILSAESGVWARMVWSTPFQELGLPVTMRRSES